MPSVHKSNPLTFRPPADTDDREWLEAHAKATGRRVGAVIVQAIREYRERVETPAFEAADS